MAKTKISELDAAAANNTDINSVDVSEGCAPSGINNAIREMGAMLKRMDNGTDHLTNPNITGDLDVDNININGNTISSTDTNGNINITPNGTGAVAFTTNATFGDNDKAIFGAGSDLQIYHDGSNSYILDTGTGGLYLKANADFYVQSQGTDETFIQAASNAFVKLFFNGSEKLATTSSGIDVTGTVTADGNFILETSGGGVNYKGLSRAFFGSLHSSNFAVLGSAAKADETANAQMIATETSTGNGLPSAIQLGAGNIDFHTIASSTANAAFDSKRMRVDKNGDISFYADDGTTQGLFWDASTQYLGVGDTTPNRKLTVQDSVGTVAHFDSTGTSGGGISLGDANTTSNYVRIRGVGNDMQFTTGNSETVRIDSSGRLLVGRTSTSSVGGLNASLQVEGTSAATSAISATRNTADDNPPYLLFGKSRGTSDGSNTVVQQNDGLGAIKWNGADGTDKNSEAARIVAEIDGTPGSDDMPGRLVFQTTSDGSNTSTERMRIASNGTLMVGTTDNFPGDGDTNTGIALAASGSAAFSRDGFRVVSVNRNTSDGTLVEFNKDGSEVGSIGVFSSKMFITTGNAGLRFRDDLTAIIPCNSDGSNSDDDLDWGYSTVRWDDIYATNGTIQTSDQNEKNTITDSDLGLDFINRLEPKSYVFNGKTRTHYGLIAQDVETVLGDISKPTSGFAGFIKSDISEEQDGSEYRYGLRYTEFVGPLIKALQEADAKIEALEARIAALEGA